MFDADRLPVIRTAYYLDADGAMPGATVCRAGHVLDLPNPDPGPWMLGHRTCEPFRWFGEANCEAAFALLGWEHSKTELDHARILGLGPGGDMEAHPGDRLIPDGNGWFFPMSEEDYQAAVNAGQCGESDGGAGDD